MTTAMATMVARRATALVARGGDDDDDDDDAMGDGVTGDGATGYDDDDAGNGQRR
jgi:hypothetical protein